MGAKRPGRHKLGTSAERDRSHRLRCFEKKNWPTPRRMLGLIILGRLSKLFSKKLRAKRAPLRHPLGTLRHPATKKKRTLEDFEKVWRKKSLKKKVWKKKSEKNQLKFYFFANQQPGFQKFACAEEASRRSSQGGRPAVFFLFWEKTTQTQNRPQKSGQFSGSFFGRFS